METSTSWTHRHLTQERCSMSYATDFLLSYQLIHTLCFPSLNIPTISLSWPTNTNLCGVRLAIDKQ